MSLLQTRTIFIYNVTVLILGSQTFTCKRLGSQNEHSVYEVGGGGGGPNNSSPDGGHEQKKFEKHRYREQYRYTHGLATSRHINKPCLVFETHLVQRALVIPSVRNKQKRRKNQQMTQVHMFIHN